MTDRHCFTWNNGRRACLLGARSGAVRRIHGIAVAAINGHWDDLRSAVVSSDRGGGGPVNSAEREQQMTKPEPSGMLSPAEVGQALNLSESTVRRLIKRGEIPATRYGKQWRVPRHALFPRRPDPRQEPP